MTTIRYCDLCKKEINSASGYFQSYIPSHISGGLHSYYFLQSLELEHIHADCLDRLKLKIQALIRNWNESNITEELTSANISL
jgi:hypothetical protein